MNPFQLHLTAVTHVVYSTMLGLAPDRPDGPDRVDRDRGAVSIEQVLWYAAAAISVAVVAGVIWNTVKTTADGVSPTDPTAPGG